MAILTIGVAVLIFIFSSQDSVTSENVSVGFAGILFEKIFGPEFAESANHFIRKCAHFSIYLMLGFCLKSTIHFAYTIFSKRTCIFISVALCFLYAVSDEIHQYFVPGRSCSFKDVLIDTAGAAFGIVISYLIFKYFKKLRKVN